jgi:hypothetical protein
MLYATDGKIQVPEYHALPMPSRDEMLEIERGDAEREKHAHQ